MYFSPEVCRKRKIDSSLVNPSQQLINCATKQSIHHFYKKCFICLKMFFLCPYNGDKTDLRYKKNGQLQQFQLHLTTVHVSYIAPKNEVFVKDFFSKCDQIRGRLKKSLMKNFIFCTVLIRCACMIRLAQRQNE